MTQSRNDAVAYLGLGSNLGDRLANLRDAVRRLRSGDLRVTAISSIYETAHVGAAANAGAIPAYLNCVLRVETSLSPVQLLHHTQQVERQGGRARKGDWEPRAIDIDVLLYGDVACDTQDLTLPHPRMLERRFVLEPLAEIAPGLVLPDGSLAAARLADPAIASQQASRIAGPESLDPILYTLHPKP